MRNKTYIHGNQKALVVAAEDVDEIPIRGGRKICNMAEAICNRKQDIGGIRLRIAHGLVSFGRKKVNEVMLNAVTKAYALLFVVSLPPVRYIIIIERHERANANAQNIPKKIRRSRHTTTL